MYTQRKIHFAAMVVCALACSRPAAVPAPQTNADTTRARPVVVDEGRETEGQQPQEDRSTVPFDPNGPRYTWSIAPAPNGTFGFVVYDRGKLYIDQQKATGLGGPDGWKTKMDARAAALAVMATLEKGEVPEGVNIIAQ